MTKEQTNNWGSVEEILKYYNITNPDVELQLLRHFSDIKTKLIFQEKEKWELETKKYRQITNLITSIFYYGNFKAETPNERELEKLLVDLNLWPTNEQIIIKRTDLLQNK